jgi:hypothetical protein
MRNVMLALQHCLNPLHLYCRLVDKGLNKKLSMSICKWYQIIVYSWLGQFSVMLALDARKYKKAIPKNPAMLFTLRD